jgi:catechol 2,3-dioxygenase
MKRRGQARRRAEIAGGQPETDPEFNHEVHSVTEYRVHPDLRMGAVHLTARDLGRSLAFYRDLLGLRASADDSGRVTLRAGEEPLVVMTGRPDAPIPPRRSTGLYHFSILISHD